MICFFEDENVMRFQPLTLTRPMDDLRTGLLTIREKWLMDLGESRFTRLTTPLIEPLFPVSVPKGDENLLWINSRVLPDASLVKQIKKLKAGECIRSGKTIIASVTQPKATVADEGCTTEHKADTDPVILEYPWNLLHRQADEIAKDAARRTDLMEHSGDPTAGIYRMGSHPVLSGERVKVEPGVVFITENGPIILDDDCTVMANAVLRGPLAVGKKAVIKSGSKILEETSIGPVCKVAGEIQSSLFHSYSNKAHEGFVGNSIFGQWVNLGADTNTSNLKNNYSSVSITDFASQDSLSTGEQFLGTIMGDHSKTSINTMLNTGTVCGVSSNIFSSAFPPKFIASFRWIGDQTNTDYQPDKALETMKAVMKRRGIELSPDYEKLMRSIAIKKF
jgi:UDP-N-acetylglucosamine diphosphorylase/glucosamine-1-phosphate N-acetyltransferase